MIAINRDNRQAVFFRPRCKLWSCPACAETNKRLWAVKAYHGAEQLAAEGAQHIAFLTLTSHERLDAAGSLAVWPSAWSKLRDRAKYASGGFDYLLVPEQHADGRLHVHAIETAGLGKRFWKDAARKSGLGYQCEEEEANTPAGAAYYVVKYLTKSIAYTNWPKGFRRVRTSRNWPKLEKMEQPEGWDFKLLASDESLLFEAKRLKRELYHVAMMGHREAWAFVGGQENVD